MGDPVVTSLTLPQDNALDTSIHIMERELPVVFDGQIFLRELLSRVMQAIYAELSEMSETMPNMSDSARKRTLADWVVKTKKQVVKLYAAVKWARDADTVQKCMNITAFLLNQNRQFEDAIRGLNYAKESLDPARLRNHDLLTSLDVLSTGTYLRLPTCIKKLVIPPIPLSDQEVMKTLAEMEEVMRYRLRTSEIIPVEMSQYRIEDGRIYFTVPRLFETSICLRGGEKQDGWFFVHVEFLINITGDLTSIQEFPRIPTGILKRHITEEADNQLAKFVPFTVEDPLPGFGSAPKPQLPSGVVDAPLVRLYNFLQMMSLSYQLEILWFQAERMRSLGWADHLSIRMSANRKILTVSYWIRSPPPPANRMRNKIPLLGGTLTISIVEARNPPGAGGGPSRSPKARIIARLQRKYKLADNKPSDEVEGQRFHVTWEPAQGALGVHLLREILALPSDTLSISPDNLNFEQLLRTIIDHHTKTILMAFQQQLQRGITSPVFSQPGVIELTDDVLRVHLCADETVIISIDARTGRFNLRDTGDLAAAGRSLRFTAFIDKLNENPTIILEALNHLRLLTITDLAEQKAKYLGLQTFRRRNFKVEELSKLGSSARGTLFIQLAAYPNHYLVLVITDDRFRYALITTKLSTDTGPTHMVMEDIAWLDFDRIRNASKLTEQVGHSIMIRIGVKRKRGDDEQKGNNMAPDLFNLDVQVLRQLYSYCCARVAYMNVERQLKLRGIPFTHVNPMENVPISKELVHIQSPLARSVPALCVQSEHILSGAPAAEAAMPNIRVVPLNWWSEENAQVVTCVKLKYVQQPMGRHTGSNAVIRPSKRIIYDTREAVVSFLSENVNTCVDEFLEEWARVSKMVVIAREVAQMSTDKRWHAVQLLSFDLQTVEFAYASDYTVSITCEDQLSPTGGNFDLRFSRRRPWRTPSSNLKDEADEARYNPHDEAEPFFRNILRHGHGRLAPSLHCLVSLLRDTLPIVVELDRIQKLSDREGHNIDTFTKAVGWYRVIYGDLKHALDFRLMSNQRVAILDGSQSLFIPDKFKNKISKSDENQMLYLQPIPQFQEIVSSSVKAVQRAGGTNLGRFAVVGSAGVVCSTRAVSCLGRNIHDKILPRLQNVAP